MVLLHEKNKLMKRIDMMERTLICSRIVDGHWDLMEKSREFQQHELDYFKRISENAMKADENKSEKVQIMQERLEQLRSSLNNKEAYIKQLREQLGELVQKLRLEECGTQDLKEANAELERRLSDAKEEIQLHREELLGCLAQISEQKKTMSDLKEELNQERGMRRDVLLRRSYKKDKTRPLSEPFFCDKS